jgi:hypothetical protein
MIHRISRSVYVKNISYVIFGLALYYLIFVILLDTGTVCFFQSIFGIPCPGCGLTRAITALCSLEFRAAFFYHPLVPMIFWIGFLFLFQSHPKIHTLYTNNRLWQVYGTLFCLVWGIRMFLLFPHHTPFVFNTSSLTFRLFELLKHTLS